MQFIYPIFLLLVLMMMARTIYQEAGRNPYSTKSYEKAQKKRKEMLSERYKIRKSKEGNVKKLIEQLEKKHEEEILKTKAKEARNENNI